jgi:hypothetical protein
MKVSKLIQDLEEMKKLHGDINVVLSFFVNKTHSTDENIYLHFFEHNSFLSHTKEDEIHIGNCSR